MELLAPAKINLSLRVLARRPDGYHDIDSWMVPLSLMDRLRVEPAPAGCEVSAPGHPALEGSGNLCVLAHRAFGEAFGEAPGLRVHLEKRIPMAAGLGGGSSDAAAVLRHLASRRGIALDDRRLLRAALAVGSDVPFFLQAAPALAGGRGERLGPAPALAFPLHLLLVHPPVAVSAGAAYRALAEARAGAPPPPSPPLRATYAHPRELAEALHNDLEAVVAPWAPVRAIAARLEAAGALRALMSGSGPTVFGIYESEEAAREGMRSLRMEPGEAIWRATMLQSLPRVGENPVASDSRLSQDEP